MIYLTGKTVTGRDLVGGVWTLFSQEGLPVELAWLEARREQKEIDWMEAMADASRTNNLPALWQQMRTFLPEEVQQNLAERFVTLLAVMTPAEFLARKRAA